MWVARSRSPSRNQRRLAVALERLHRRPTVAGEAPAELPVLEAGERVHDGVVVGADEEAVALGVVGGVDDDGQPVADDGLEALGELRPADAAGQLDDARPPARRPRSRPSSEQPRRPRRIRSIVSRSYGAGSRTITVEKPRSRNGAIAVGDELRAGRARCGPSPGVLDAVVGEALAPQAASASAASSRMTIGKLIVSSISDAVAPDVGAVLVEDRRACAVTSSSVARRCSRRRPAAAAVRSVFFGPEPPMRIGRWAWTGRGSHRASRIV